MRMLRLLLAAIAVLFAIVWHAGAVWAVSGVVSGAEFLNVRRGPGPEFPAFARLERGQRVEVVKIEGSWATVRTPGGAEGFVHRQYLTFPAGQLPPEIAGSPIAARSQASPTRAPAVAAAPPPAAAGAIDQVRVLREENARLAAELNALRDQLTTRSADAVAPAPPASAPAANDELRNDVQRLLQMTEEVRSLARTRQADGAGADTTAVQGGDSWLASNGWVLAVSVVFGGLIGSVYGRLQERRRRSRIRF